MFEKCELATSTPRNSTKLQDDICTSASLIEDFNEFAQQVILFFNRY